jgi:hydroxymethylpyrimidine/phosphomethylpyrimidine kinase / thiaminase
MTATTALTAQDTTAVHDVFPIPASFVSRQIEVCIKDVGVDVVKTGMLASAETIEAVAAVLVANQIKTIVVDPVMVSTSGANLLPNRDVETLTKMLVPLATVLTPNIPEAKLLLMVDGTRSDQLELEDVQDVENMARRVRALGPEWVLLKGGHLPFTSDLKVAASDTPAESKKVVDVLCGPEGIVRIETRFQESKNTHGTGCTLACKCSDG